MIGFGPAVVSRAVGNVRQACAVLIMVSGSVVLAASASAETVEVYPSTKVTKHTYDAPLNEQPFYGFMPKSDAMLAADRKFIEAVEKNTGREVGADEFQAMGWNAVQGGDFTTAAKRFNQAWLLAPGRSVPVHGLAVVAAARFGDLDFAIELASVAAGLRNPLPALSGDQGGLLIKAGKPGQAIPYLEKAAATLPDWVNPQINLALARFDTGDVRETCRLLGKVEQMLKDRPGARSTTIDNNVRTLTEKAQCGSL